MAFLTSQKWYCGSTKWTAVAAWTALTAYTAGQLVRQLATPTVGNERVFACIIAGTSLAVEPTWTVTQGAKTAEAAGPTWIEVTGKSSVNGDLTNTPNWTTVKNTAVSQGVIIQRNNGASYQICTTAGTAGNGAEPAFSNTAGVTTSDNTVTWTSLGVVGNFAAWSAPWARLNLALASGFFVLNGDTVYVSNNHAATQASSIAYNNLTTGTTIPVTVVCVSDTAVPPTALATTATESTTGANAVTVGVSQNNGAVYIYGMGFVAGSAASNASLALSGFSTNGTIVNTYLDTCTFTLGNTNTSSTFQFSSNDPSSLTVRNCNFVFGATGQNMFNASNQTSAATIIGGTIAASGSVPTTLFLQGFTVSTCNYIIRDVNISAVTGTLVTISSEDVFNLSLQNCSLGSGVTLFSGTPSNLYTPTLRLNNCDSGATNYRYYVANKLGTVQQETTIVRTGGATNGTTPISWNFTSTSFPTYSTPFASDEITIWNSTTGSSITPTIYLTTNTTLDNSQAWIDVEYLGSSSNPLGTVATTRAALLSTPSTLTSDSSTWGGAISNKYSISTTFTPQLAGPIKIKFYLSKPSVTVYLDPQIGGLSTASRDYFIPGQGYINETSTGSAGGMIVHPGMVGGAHG